MSDQPVTQAEFQVFRGAFEAFQVKLFSHLTSIDSRFETLEQKMDARFDEVAGQFDALFHRVLRLEDEATAITQGLARVEREVERLGVRVTQLEATVLRLDERLSRVEKRLDELVAAEPRYALRTEVQDLTGRVDALRDRLDSLEKRFHRP